MKTLPSRRILVTKIKVERVAVVVCGGVGDGVSFEFGVMALLEFLGWRGERRGIPAMIVMIVRTTPMMVGELQFGIVVDD